MSEFLLIQSSTAILSLIAAILIGARIFSSYHPALIIIRSFWLVALLTQIMMIHSSVFTPDGLNISVVNAIAITVFMLSAVLFLICFYQSFEILAIFILPISALLSAMMETYEVGQAQSLVDLSPGISLHIVFSLTANSILILVAALAVLLHRQNISLRRGDNKVWLKNLPPLDAAESFLFKLLTTGLILLTLSLINGWVYLENMLEQHLAHKTVLSMLSWMVLAVLFGGHLFLGWRGERFLKLTLTGTILLIVAYLGSKIVLELILKQA